MILQRLSGEDDLGDHLGGDQMPPQAQAIQLLYCCNDVPANGVKLRVLKLRALFAPAEALG